MALKKRDELKMRFTNGLRPSQKDFADVIDSVFNKRDDQFFGRWRPGTVYRKGDVVIHKRTLWQVEADQDLCSNAPPEPGPHWKSLIVPHGDEDWLIIGDLEEPGDEPLIMYANEAVDCVGIGTRAPKARLDVVEAGKSRFLLGPKAAACTAFTLVNRAGEARTYLLTGLDEDAATWLSDVPGGFVFRHGAAAAEGEHDQLDCRDGDLLMVIQPDTGGLVRVGIGTDKPDGMLDVTDRRRGQFVFNPEDKHDPVFTIVNLGAESEQNYLASGVGAERAVFVTDAPEGFVFKQGGEYGTFLNEENIDQGRTLVGIAPDGKLGVGRVPEAYQLDVNGMIRAYTLYLDTDRNNMARPGNPGPMLERVMRLEPVRFEWRVVTGFADEGEQLGLIAQDVEAIFPQVVKTNSDGSKAVAYPNLVAVVIKAVQEQQALITQQRDQINQQQNQLDTQQQQIDQQQQVNLDQQQTIDALAERVAGLQERLGQQQDLNDQQQQLLDDHAARIDALEQRLEDQPDVSELMGLIDAQQAINEQQQEQIDALIERLQDQPDVSELVARIDAQQAVNDAQQEQIDAQQAINARQQGQIDAQEAINTRQQNQIAAQEEINDLQEERIVAQEEQIAAQQEAIEGLEKRVAEIEGTRNEPR